MELEGEPRARWISELEAADPAAAGQVRALLADDTLGLELEPPLQANWLTSLGQLGLRSGERLGSWELREPIAAGGMGQVYRAVRADAQFEKEVAIKLVKRGMDSDEILRRFRLERQVLAGLEHPGIARLLDGGVSEGGQPFLVMELVDGVPIDRYCDEHRLSTSARLGLVQAVCAAVHFAHQHLVVHRDIKPNNVLVTPEGRVKLLDFGVAKVLADEAAGADATAAGAAWLTPEYASPEQLGGRPLTTVSDIYSLGVLLYRLLTGRRPHELTGRPRHQLERILLEEEPQRPSEIVTKTLRLGGDATDVTPEELAGRRGTNPTKLRGHLLGDLDNIVLQALAKEPQRRYSTAKELAEDIGRHLAGLPVLARRGSLLYRGAKFLRRNQLSVGLSTLTLAALVAGLVLSWLSYLRAERASESAQRRFSQVHELAQVFLFDIGGELEAGAGTTSARERIAATALDYLQRLSEESRGDPQLALELADGYMRLGELQGGLGRDNLGQLEAAAQSFARADALLASLPVDASDERLACARVRILVRLGDSALQRGEATRALALYRSASDELARASLELPAAGGEREELELELEGRLADQLESQGQLADALRHRRAQLALTRALARREERASTQLVLARTLDALAALLERDGSEAALEEAAELRLESQDHSELALSLDPGDRETRAALGSALHASGRRLLQQRRGDEAIEVLTRALEHFRWLAQADPASAQNARNLGIGLTELGYALGFAGRREEALALHREAIEVKARVLALESGNALARRSLGIARRATAELLAGDGLLDEALEMMRAAYGDFEQLAQASPESGEAQIDQVIADAIMGKVQIGLARRELDSGERRLVQARQAFASYERALTRLEALERAGTRAPGQEQLRAPLERDLRRAEELVDELQTGRGSF